MHNFNDKFTNQDIERLNEIDILVDRLKEEGELIGGSLSSNYKSKDESNDTANQTEDTETLHKMKRSIIQSINTLVN